MLREDALHNPSSTTFDNISLFPLWTLETSRTDKVLSSVGDVGRDGGQEIERIVDLKVPIRPLHHLCLVDDGTLAA